MIELMLNHICIDSGKSRYFTPHSWLFPPGSIKPVQYIYADNVIETKPGFQVELDAVLFRLNHLGYSMQETKSRYDGQLARWNRTQDLQLPFEEFYRRVASIRFCSRPPDFAEKCFTAFENT